MNWWMAILLGGILVAAWLVAGMVVTYKQLKRYDGYEL